MARRRRTRMARSTMDAERAGKAATETRSVWRALADPRVLGLALVYFGTSAGLYTLGVWAPQIIKSFGLSTSRVGLLNALPPTVAVVAMVLWSRHSDRTNERPWHVIFACLAASWASSSPALPTRSSRSSPRSRWSMSGSRRRSRRFGACRRCFSPALPPPRVWRDQLDRQSRRLRRPADDRLDQEPDRDFSGGLYFVAGLLIVSAYRHLPRRPLGRPSCGRVKPA